MAGDWIKMAVGLHEKPEVIAIATETSKNRFDVVGRLHRLWGWFDQHSSNGHAKSVTPVTVDELVGCDGFATALINVGWLVVTNDGISMPNFDRHNGQSAKKRAENTERKRKSRNNLDNGHDNVADMSRKKCDQSETREEKRREDKKNPPNPPRGNAALAERFKRFWDAYPNRVGKGQAERAFAKLNPDDLMLGRLVRAIQAQTEDRSRKSAAGEFVPPWKNPSTWLNGKCWEDEISQAQPRKPKPAEDWMEGLV